MTSGFDIAAVRAAFPALALTDAGIGNANRLASRVPTFTFSIAGHDAPAVAAALADRNIYCWAGNFYAWEPATALGLREGPGALRIGLSHYNAADEVDALIEALREITR